MKKVSELPFLFVTFVLIVSACNIPYQEHLPSAPAAAPSSFGGPTSAPAGAVEHRIGIRVVNGEGEFFNRVSGEKFIPRGNNFIQLEPQKRADGSTQIYHALFDPGIYDAAEVNSAFQQMHAQGYNVVRVFLSQNTIGTPTNGLDPAYMENVADLLRLAHANGLYVIPTIDWMPGGKYGALLDQDCCDKFTMMNVNFLTPGGLQANQAFFRDFAKYLLEHGAPMDALLAYELRNELYFDMNFPPFSLTSGALPTLNGKTYDMSDAADRQKMMDENLVYWIDRMREAILEVDPTALVAVGFFWPQEPNPARIGDPRQATTRPAIWESSADFIDLHLYPASELTLKQYVENFGLQGMQEKPVIMGEFGVAREGTSTEQAAARILMDWQVESCKYGFDGWLLWEWNAKGSSDYYAPMSGEGDVNKVLAPLYRPDPCQTAQFDFIENNVALRSRVSASRFLQTEPPSNAVDGTGAQWGAGASPTQWIQIDLGKAYTVREIRLTVAQYPEGPTTHQVWAHGPDGPLVLIHTFSGPTREGQVLSFKPDQPLSGLQIIRITTTSSPSWVAWKEIEVIAP